MTKVLKVVANVVLVSSHWFLVVACPAYLVLCLATSFESPTVNRICKS